MIHVFECSVLESHLQSGIWIPNVLLKNNCFQEIDQLPGFKIDPFEMWQNDVTKVTSPEPGGFGQANQNLEGRSRTVTELTTVSIGLKNK